VVTFLETHGFDGIGEFWCANAAIVHVSFQPVVLLYVISQCDLPPHSTYRP
jgi:membrane protein YqaA with SNARE-associated domain